MVLTHAVLQRTAVSILLCLLQLMSENLFNAPGLDIAFSDTQSLQLSEATKAALSMVPYTPSAAVPFASWSTPVETPTGVLANDVPFDRNGVARQQGNILPGGLGVSAQGLRSPALLA